jgi:hypothetical protein
VNQSISTREKLTSSAKETGNCVMGLTAMSSMAVFRL